MARLGLIKEIVEWSNELGQWATMMWSHTPDAAKKALSKSWGGFGSQDNATFQFHILPLLSGKQRVAIANLLHVLDQHDRDRLTEMMEKAVLEKKMERDVNEGKKDKKGNPLPPKKVTETVPDFSTAARGLKQIADAVIAYQATGGADLKGWAYAQHFGGSLFDQPTFGERVSTVANCAVHLAQTHGPVVAQVVGSAAEVVVSEGERLVQQAQLAEQVRQSRARRSWFNLPGRIIQRLFNL